MIANIMIFDNHAGEAIFISTTFLPSFKISHHEQINRIRPIGFHLFHCRIFVPHIIPDRCQIELSGLDGLLGSWIWLSLAIVHADSWIYIGLFVQGEVNDHPLYQRTAANSFIVLAI